jgi:endonuclease/exonuclease/phosphatase family metal-dependent hydrolase
VIAARLQQCDAEIIVLQETARPFLMLGDFNAGMSGTDAHEYRFKAGSGFAKLASLLST